MAAGTRVVVASASLGVVLASTTVTFRHTLQRPLAAPPRHVA